MERGLTGTGSPEGMDDVHAALDVLRHRQLDLQRRHEVLIEYVARFPNAVNCRQEREISSARSAGGVRYRHTRAVAQPPGVRARPPMR